MHLSIGLPRMHKEPGERRDFLPEMVRFLDRLGAREIVIERGYGGGMGLHEREYLEGSARARLGSLDDCLAQDLVLVVRCPSDDAMRRMRPGAILVSMLHYPTRPGRVALLREAGVRGVSLDGMTDERGRRFVENLQSVGWNGVRAAFRELRRTYRRFDDPRRRPLRVTVLGSGAVGGHAAKAATRYGDPALRETMTARGVAGVEVTVLDFDLTGSENYMLTRLEQTDLLVDATYRPDSSRPVIPNDWVAALPGHAVMLDLSVDPYDLTVSPPVVKGIEGIPEGNLDQFVFPVDDPAWDRLPPPIGREHRRLALSCYSWPGVDAADCMDVYGRQIEPILRVLLTHRLDDIDPVLGTIYERAVARADSARWKNAARHR